MKIFEIEFMNGTNAIHLANRRMDIWNKFPPGTIYCIHEVIIR